MGTCSCRFCGFIPKETMVYLGKAPTELFLSRHLPTRLDCLKPDPRNKIDTEVWKQKVYHDANVRARSFMQGDEVRRKHAEQTRSRSGAMDDKLTQTVVNQQQEVEGQE
ncbi:hypothetical protein J437_LFUL017696 [Ladona fulva]|uniref:Uncharacterized protein n=1 Tax=Ladona fulva TaxID=123851 RepID=A0A8K0KQE2_LADFU|nr:hypothetical protein J437_LFUL017696 [Ladona fulva]